MSEASYHDSVTVETEVKQNDDIYHLDIINFKYFGLSEKAIQTDLTLKDIMKIDYNNKQIKENKGNQEPLMAPFSSSIKKESPKILIEPIKDNNLGNKLFEAKNDNNNDDINSNLSKSAKKTKKEDKKEGKKDKDSFLDKKRKRVDEEKQSPSKNKLKFKDINKIKERDKEKEKLKIKLLKEKTSKIKQKEDKPEKLEKILNSSDKKDKLEKQDK